MMQLLLEKNTILLCTKFDEQKSDFNDRFDINDEKFKSKFNELKGELSNSLKSIDVKFTEINNRLNNTDEKFNELNNRFDINDEKFESKFNELKGELSNSLKSIDVKFTEINNRFDNRDEKFNELSARSERNFNELNDDKISDNYNGEVITKNNKVRCV